MNKFVEEISDGDQEQMRAIKGFIRLPATVICPIFLLGGWCSRIVY